MTDLPEVGGVAPYPGETERQKLIDRFLEDQRLEAERNEERRDRDLQRAIEEGRRAQDIVSAVETRLGAWLALGNAAAVLLCFQALMDHKVCHWESVQPLAFTFGVGCALAFVSPVLQLIVFDGQRRSSGQVKALNRMITARARQKPKNMTIEQSREHAAELAEWRKPYDEKIRANRRHNRRMNMMSHCARGLLAVSALCLSGAATTAIMSPYASLALCPAKPAT